MEKRFRVTLTEEERQGLQKLVSVGRGAARKLVRARILLQADQGEGGPAKPDPEIVEALGCGRATVERVRLPRGVRGGRCGCSATEWWAWDIWNRCLMKRSGKR